MTREEYYRYKVELGYQSFLKDIVKTIKSNLSWSSFGEYNEQKREMNIVLDILENAIENSKERQKKL